MKHIITTLLISLIFSATSISNFSLKLSNETKLEETKSVIKLNSKTKRANYTDSTYDVFYDCSGGTYNSTVVSFSETVIADSLLTEPDRTKMHKNYASFDGWYLIDGTAWNFSEDTVTQDVTLRAKWNWDNSYRVENIGSKPYYFSQKYYLSSNWNRISSNSINNIPIEVGDNDTDGINDELDKKYFPQSDINTAINTSGIASSYGGCGPIAMMGIMDYFARNKNYSSIMNNPENSTDRIQLAYDIFTNTNTSEWPMFANETYNLENNINNLNETMLYSGGSKNTLTFPGDYVDGFNTLMTDKYHLNNQISAHSQGWFLVSKNSKINKVKESIDNGLPVTIYAGQAGAGYFGNHYVNAYAYEVWQGKDRDGKTITNTLFNTRLNWGWGQSYDCHMDADMLSALFSGIIYYKVTDSNQLIRPIDFSTKFVNENGQGQYFFYDKTEDITTSNGFTFGTSRLRCGYIENQYLVLSANRSGAGRASLEMNFDINVKAINFDLSLWSGLESLTGQNDYVKLFYLDSENQWQEQMQFSVNNLSTLKQYPDNFYTQFPIATNGIKFEVFKENPTGDRNKGRVVIGNMNLFY